HPRYCRCYARVVRRVLVLSLAMACGCGGHSHLKAPAHRVPRGDDLTLFRDWAVIRQHVEVDLKGPSTIVKAQLAAGVTSDQIVVLDRGGMAISSLLVERHDADA